MPDAPSPQDLYDETVRDLLLCDVSFETIAQLLSDLYDGTPPNAPPNVSPSGSSREPAEPAQ